jgi:hypothetical protein
MVCFISLRYRLIESRDKATTYCISVGHLPDEIFLEIFDQCRLDDVFDWKHNYFMFAEYRGGIAAYTLRMTRVMLPCLCKQCMYRGIVILFECDERLNGDFNRARLRTRKYIEFCDRATISKGVNLDSTADGGLRH